MKKIVGLVITIISCNNLFAQLTGDAAYRDNAGLQGDAGAKSGAYETSNPVNFPAGASTWWHFFDVRHTNTANNFAMQFAGSFFDQNLFFRKTNNNPAQPWSRVLTENSSGFVGIGTTVPSVPLHIIGGNGNTIFLEKPANNNPAIAWKGANYTSVLEGGDHLNFYTNGGYRMHVDAGGNIGIATASPQELLQLGDAPNANNYKISIPGVYNFENIRLGQYGNGSGALEFINHSGTSKSYGMRMYVNTDQVPGLHFQYAPAQADYNALSYTTGMFMDVGGNVGVGTTKPTQKLSVAGTILAKKVKVSQSASDWPDYVFASSYQLPSLDSVSSFIQANKHLPDMPSAATVEKEGHDVGEVQKQLLKKVEELTLYVIEQNKTITELKSEIQELKNKK